MLGAADLYAVLGLPSGVFAPPAAVRRAFYAKALKIHPDKSSDASATEAFQRLSAAFEELYDEASQRAYLTEIGGGGDDRGAARRGKRRKADPTPRSWADVERDLARREAAEAALRAAYVRGQSSRYATREEERRLRSLRQIARELDARRGVDFNARWGVSRREAETGASAEDAVERAKRASRNGDPEAPRLQELADARVADEALDAGAAFARLPAPEQIASLVAYLEEAHGWAEERDDDDDGGGGDDFAEFDFADW